MKNTICKIIVNIMLIVMLISSGTVVHATGQFLEDNKNSVVQVVVYYTAEDGKRSILQTGSGIVINSNTVLTNQHIVHLSDNNMEKARELVGIKDLNHDALLIGIVKQDDVLINASITQESEEKDFALLTLSEVTDRKPAMLGSSSSSVTAESVMAIGYPTTKPFGKEGAQLFAASDVNLTAGVIAEATTDKMKVSGVISAGNSGGALIRVSTGELIGLLVYNKDDAKKECFTVLPIDSIKDPYLAGTTYSDNSVAPTTEETEATEVVDAGPVVVDKIMLQQTIDSARGLNREEYTEESYLYMYDAIKEAEYVLSNENATQEEVDRATRALQDSKQTLTVKEGANWVLITCIAVAIIIIIVVITVVVILVVKNNKNEKARNEFKVLPTEDLPVYSQTIQPQGTMSPMAATQEYNMQSGNQETTILNAPGNDNNNATTVLSHSAPEICAYLVRKKNGEKKKIDSIEFTVGKDVSRVNYCVRDNTTISRCHMKIIKRGMQYYAMDLGSTNHTFINDAIIPPNQEFEIKNGDSIKVSDEEFTFEMM